MKELRSFLDHKVEAVLSAYFSKTGRHSPPVAVSELALAVGVAVEYAEMIPEAVLRVEGNQFRIILRNNFQAFSGSHVRQRFSLAHEIAHTFFFEDQDGQKKPIRGAPTGQDLEAACHTGAGLMLIPDRILNEVLREVGGDVSADALLRFSRMFDTSPEVMLRRLLQGKALENAETGLVLVRRLGQGVGVIEAGAYPVWTRTVAVTPKRGVEFLRWFYGKEFSDLFTDENEGVRNLQENGMMTRTTPGGLLCARAVELGNSLQVFELSLRRM